MKSRILAVAVLLIGLGGISLGQSETAEVSTPDGVILGNCFKSRDGRVYKSFKGIRYATIGGRFESSRPVEPWSEPLEATEFGAKCPQIGMGDGVIDEGDENCLFLNVYVPKVKSRRLLPVMVWIHGGGFLDGAGSHMGPDYFMDEDIILVTINYRLGAFGFLSTADDIVQGNNGLRDMVNALKWVQRNVQSFGGAPRKVTIFGESAGGVSVHLLMLSPAAKGLFRGVISQSGNALVPWAVNTSPVKYARMLGAETNCPSSNSTKLVECLKSKTPKEILEGMQRVTVNAQGSTIVAFSPSIEFKPSSLAEDFPILTDTPYNLLTKKHILNSRDVPLIIGLNEMEGIALFAAQFIASEEQLDKLDGNWVQMTSIPFNYEYFVPEEKKDEFGEIIRQYYFGEEPLSSENIHSLINLHTECFFFRGFKLSAELHANLGAEVYPYVLNYRGDFSLARFIGLTGEGPTHADDLQYLFKSLKEPPEWLNVKNGTEDEKFSKRMVKLWASFAIHGEPVESWGEPWTPAEASRPGSVEHSWLSLDKEAKMVKNEAILARINKLDYLYSEYELPKVSWRTKNSGRTESVWLRISNMIRLAASDLQFSSLRSN